MKVKILRKGDSVISVSGNLVAVQRKNCEVDIIPLIPDENGFPMIDTEHILTIGYGSGSVESKVRNADGDDVTLFTF